jgi:hypothetical protein
VCARLRQPRVRPHELAVGALALRLDLAERDLAVRQQVVDLAVGTDRAAG